MEELLAMSAITCLFAGVPVSDLVPDPDGHAIASVERSDAA
jgi:hypothetical protein